MAPSSFKCTAESRGWKSRMFYPVGKHLDFSQEQSAVEPEGMSAHFSEVVGHVERRSPAECSGPERKCHITEPYKGHCKTGLNPK